MGACLSRRASAEVGPERYAPGTSSHAAQEEYALVMKTLVATGRSSAEVTVDDEIEVQGDQTVDDSRRSDRAYTPLARWPWMTLLVVLDRRCAPKR